MKDLTIKDGQLYLADDIEYYPLGFNIKEDIDELSGFINEFIYNNIKSFKRELTYTELNRCVNRGMAKYMNNWRKNNNGTGV